MHLQALSRATGQPRPTSAGQLADWAAGVDAAVAPSRATVNRWLRGITLPNDFASLAVVVQAVAEKAEVANRPPPDPPWLFRLRAWQEAYDRACDELGRGEGANAQRPPVVYQGLDSFHHGDTERFYGRSGEIAALRDRLDQLYRSGGGGPLMVLAASGVGKTSLLAAGLLPQIEEHGLPSEPAASRWPALVITPGHDPLTALTDAIPALRSVTAAPDLDAAGVRSAISAHLDCHFDAHLGTDLGTDRGAHIGLGAQSDADSSCTIGDIPAAAVPVASPRRLILVVDQFEELFQIQDCPRAKSACDRFVETLAFAATAQDNSSAPALVVLAARDDFFPRLRRLRPIKAALNAPYNLEPMTANQLTEAIREPARAAGITLAPDLIPRILADSGVTEDSDTVEGKLPLISHLLQVMNTAGPMTMRAYEDARGIDGAVAHTADQAWATLNTLGLGSLALNLLLHLVNVAGAGGQDTRRSRSRAELLDIAVHHEHSDDHNTRERVNRALGVLSDARLITLSAGTVSITHEALLRAWRRLRDVIDNERAELTLCQDIERRARQWVESGRPTDRLYRGTELHGAHRLTRRYRVGEQAREFLADAEAHERRDTARRRRMTLASVAAVALIAAFAVFAAISGVAEKNEADYAKFTAVLAQADRLQTTDPSLAAQLDLVAHQMRPDDRAVIGRIFSTQNAPLATPLPDSGTAAIDFTAFSPDSHTLATASNNIQLWDLTRPGPPTRLGTPLKAGPSYVSTAAFSPDGHLLASTGGDGVLRLWGLDDRTHPVQLAQVTENHGASSLLAFSPDGHTVATANYDGTTTLWDVTTPAHPHVRGGPLAGHTGIVRTVAFSPDGHLVATGGDDTTILLWNISNPDHPIPLEAALRRHHEAVHSLAFSPDGHTLASGSDDKTARLWDITDPHRPAPLGDPLAAGKGAVWSVAFTPDGRTLATGSQDGTAKLWNVATHGAAVQIGADLPTRTGGIFAVSFSPDGHRLATGGDDGTTLLWDLPTTVLAGPASRVYTAAFSPDGHTLAVGSHDHTISLWDLADPARPTPIGQPWVAHNGIVTRLVFSPNGHTLISESGDDHTVRFWDLTDRAHPHIIGQPLIRNTQYQSALAISPNGQTLVTSATDTTAQLWSLADLANPEPLGPPLGGSPSFLSAAAFNPGGTILATAGYDGTLQLWNITNLARPAALGPPLHTGAGKIRDVAFSPDGHTLASTGEDKTLRLWNITEPNTPTPIATMRGHDGALYATAFAPGGGIIATASADTTARLWDSTNPDHAPEPLTGHTGKVITVAFSPHGGLLATGSEDNTVRIWNLDLKGESRRICAVTPGALTHAEWTQLLPTLTYHPPC
jgi:WD40 repeat protein